MQNKWTQNLIEKIAMIYRDGNKNSITKEAKIACNVKIEWETFDKIVN